MSLYECINFMLTRAQNSVFSVFKGNLAKYDVTPVQYAVLKCLWEKGDQSPTQLSQALFLDTSTITGILARMEKKSLIERIHSEVDRRAVHIRIKPLGKSLQTDIENTIRESNMAVLSKLSDEEFEQFKSLLNHIVETADSLEAGGGAGFAGAMDADHALPATGR